MISKLGLALGGAMLLAGCAGMSDTQQRALTGTVGGAAVGSVIGAIGGNAGMGAAAGAGAGLAGGLLFDRARQNEEAAFRRGVAQGQRSR